MRRVALAAVVLTLAAGCGGGRHEHRVQRFADDVFSLKPDGTGLRNLTKTPRVAEHYVSVAPDGTTLAFYRHEKLIVRRAGTEQDLGRVHLGEFPEAPSWSLNGRSLAISQGFRCDEYQGCARNEVWVVDLRSGTRRRASRDGTEPAWLADGRLLYSGRFRLRPSNPSGTEHEFWPTRTIVGTRVLRARSLFDSTAVPAPRGDWIAYPVTHECTRHCGLFLIRSEGTTGPLIARDVGFGRPVWSSDGRRIAFTCGPYAALCVNGLTGDLVRRFRNVRLGANLVLSPNGRFLAWSQCFPDGSRPGCTEDIVVGSLRTGRRWRITHNRTGGARMDSLSWAPDGRIVFSGTKIRF